MKYNSQRCTKFLTIRTQQFYKKKKLTFSFLFEESGKEALPCNACLRWLLNTFFGGPHTLRDLWFPNSNVDLFPGSFLTKTRSQTFFLFLGNLSYLAFTLFFTQKRGLLPSSIALFTPDVLVKSIKSPEASPYDIKQR